MKLSSKIFFIILGVSIAPLLIGGYVFYFNIQQQVTNIVLSKLDAIAQIQKNRLQADIDDKNEMLSLFTAKLQLESDLNSFNNKPTLDLQESMNNNMLQEQKNIYNIKKILLANTAGKVVASTEPGLMGSNISSQVFFEKGIKQNDVYTILKDPAGGTYRYLSGPMILNGKTIGVAIIVTGTDDISSLTNDYTGLGNTGETLLVENDGLGNALFLSAARFDKNAALTRTILKSQTNVPAVVAITGEEKLLTNSVDYRGVPVFAATRYIKSAGWGIVVKIDKDEALATSEKLKNLFLFIILAIIFLIIITAIPVSFSITKPIKKLSDLSKKVAGGDLSQSLLLKTKDEIGSLSYFLNQMVGSLKKVTEKYKNLDLNLEKEVKTATSRLENQNIFLSEANKAMLNLSEDLEQERNNLAIAKTNNDAVITSVGDALIVTDANGLIINMNPAAENMFGLSSSSAVGKSIFSVSVIEDENGEFVPEEKRAIKISLTKKKTVHTNYVLVREKKTKVIIAVTSAPVILNGKVVGGVDVLRDITTEKEIDKAKTEFVSLASHQLRTPATAVKWYSEMLLGKKAGKLSARQLKYVGEIYHGNERMIKLINNLLSISRIELGKISVKNELVDVKDLLKSIITEQKAEILKRKHKLTVEQPAGELKVAADPVLLRMILGNFISNAVKYTLKKGEIICTIKKEGSEEFPKFIFSIKDNGIGIPGEDQKRIFEKLFRASNSLEVDKEGNGLGLYIAKKITETLGGKVWFESKLGKGTTFYLELPLKKDIIK